MKKIIVCLICLVIFVGALGAVLMERSFQPESAPTWTTAQQSLAEQEQAGEGRSVFSELGLYIA